ncbi:MAG: hypothetical protein ABL994_05255, partial [Verrucomicrobiales bacterium]
MHPRVFATFSLAIPLLAPAEEGVKPSREAAWSVEEERKSIELDGPYEVRLVAAEPLVRDPVEMTWDTQGRCFVADMIDYPLGPEPGKP